MINVSSISIQPTEEIIKERLLVDPTTDVFPITLVKYLLNQDKILNFFNLINENNIEENPSFINSDSSVCEACINNQRNMMCRKHTSIKRVMDSKIACFDEDTDIYLYMNEIFKRNNDRLAVIYAPHTKLIQGPITSYKVKKISSLITRVNDDVKPFEKVYRFKSSELSTLYMKCWFNDEFSLITNPEETGMSFCLVPNK